MALIINYTHSFNRPNDNTVVGSTALAKRNNEVTLHAFWEAFIIKMQEQDEYSLTRSVVVPRNDITSSGITSKMGMISKPHMLISHSINGKNTHLVYSSYID